MRLAIQAYLTLFLAQFFLPFSPQGFEIENGPNSEHAKLEEVSMRNPAVEGFLAVPQIEQDHQAEPWIREKRRSEAKSSTSFHLNDLLQVRDLRSFYLPRVRMSRINEPDIFIHFDRYGLIVQADGDGGDTAQRTGMFYFIHRDPTGFRKALDKLEVRPGIYVRHPFQEGFRNDPLEFSRDQQRALVMALGKYNFQGHLWRLIWTHVSRLGKYQNRDFIGPSHLGEYIRALRSQTLYPVLWITDIGLLVSSIKTATIKRVDLNDVDDNNHIMSLAQARETLPTPISWLARKIYKKFRPENRGTILLGERCAAQGALSWYHRAESGGNPYISEAYRDTISMF